MRETKNSRDVHMYLRVESVEDLVASSVDGDDKKERKGE
jgi:hypothetical protein